LLAVTAGLALADPPAIGEKTPFFSFKDIRYLPRTLHDIADAKVHVLGLANIMDPKAERFLAELAELHKTYVSDGVSVMAVDIDPATGIGQMAWRAVELDAQYPFVKDQDGEVRKALGVAEWPVVAVLDKDHVLHYRGAFDKAAAAVKAVLAKEEAPDPVPVDGQPVAETELPDPAEPVTFAKDIAPILKRNCVSCHQPNEVAPFSLMDYEDAAGHAEMIAEVVREERMPPWYALDGVGSFINKRGLSDKEKLVIAQWVQGGKEQGDLSQAPEMPKPREEKWAMDTPDLVVTAETQELPAEGYIPYRYIGFPYQFPEDTWIQGLEILPSNPSVVHHANLAYMPAGGEYDGYNNFLIGKVPGAEPLRLSNNIAMMIPKGSVLVLQVHYVTTGKAEQDVPAIGIRYAKEKINKKVHFKIVQSLDFKIPPHDPLHEVRGEQTLDTDATGLALFGHMHLRGRDFQFKAHYPDGKSEQLLVVPNYSFDWQMAYQWMPGFKQFAKGTRIELIAHFDNSAFNPYNPDPSKTVEWGPQTFHEMCDGYFFYLDNNENLNLQVDPETGQAVEQVAMAEE
jgi:mono/diheme cytochrome c family protein